MNGKLSHLDEQGRVRMVDVSNKPVTTRRAVAEGRVRISAKLAAMIQDRSLPKGDLYSTVRLAGIAAAKRTAELIPLCHNVVLNSVDLEVRLESNEIVLLATVVADAKTGVEMEALTAVSVAALTVVDMGKSIDRSMVIGPIRLLEKTGGARGSYFADARGRGIMSASRPITAAVLTCSDRCSRGESQDESGPAVVELLKTQLAANILAVACLADDAGLISRLLRSWALDDPKPDLILTTGGTGLSPRDVTPEATAAVLQRRHPGLLELARLRCLATTPKAYLSRGEAGTLGRSLIINLPGSPRGAREFLEALLDVLPHAVETLRGQEHQQDAE